MKNLLKMLAAFVAILAVGACDAEQDDKGLPSAINPSSIDIEVTKSGNMVTMVNHTEKIIPYWSYRNANGDELGHSNQHEASVMLPFAGTYTIHFTAYSQGGAVDAEPVTITIDQNNEEFFSAPEWAMLTNGAEGKTWVLDMASPIGWAGLDYPWDSTGDYWNWYPDYAGNSWVMEDKDWGEMTFNLDGGYNVSVTQTALTGNEQTTKNGSFSYDIEGHTLKFNGGVEMLFGGDYYPDVSNWTTVDVMEVTETSLRLAVIRDQDRDGEGVCKIQFHFKPKE